MLPRERVYRFALTLGNEGQGDRRKFEISRFGSKCLAQLTDVVDLLRVATRVRKEEKDAGDRLVLLVRPATRAPF